MISLFHVMRKLARRLRGENLHQVLLVLAALIVTGSVFFWIFEKDLSLGDAVWWAIVTVTTVGYGDISPATVGGRLVGVMLMMMGIGFLGILTATIAGIFIERKIMENKGMVPTDVNDHFLICGWNYRGPEIVAELRADDKSRETAIVILAELEQKPLDDPLVHFIQGTINTQSLENANARAAKTAMMLADENLEVQYRDAKTILDTLTVKSHFPHLYVCVELMETKNVEYGQLAKADEIIVVGELGTNLMAQAALDHGITHMITELVSNRFGSDLYKVDIAPVMAGRSFYDVLCELKEKKGILCVGVEDKAERRLMTNPDAEYRLKAEDQLVVIASKRPVLV